jgi:hypothetical protein
MKNDLTIVTAFINSVNIRKDRDVNWIPDVEKNYYTTKVFIQREMYCPDLFDLYFSYYPKIVRNY